MSEQALVSVIVPLFNRAMLVQETIASVQTQSYKNWELILVDDHSTDDSLVVAQDYSRQDSRIKAFKRDRQPRGAATCRNIGIEKSLGTYLVFLDADDLLNIDCLSNRVHFLKSKFHLDFAVFPMSHFKNHPGESNKTWRIGQTEEDDLDRFLKNDRWLLIGWLTTSPLWTRKALERLGGFDESLLDWQDWDLHVRALISGLGYEKVDTAPDWCYRMGGSDKISKSKTISIRNKIACRINMFVKISNLLKESKKLNYYRTAALCRLCYNAASVLLLDNQKQESLRAFNNVKKIATPVLYWKMKTKFFLKLLFLNQKQVPV